MHTHVCGQRYTRIFLFYFYFYFYSNKFMHQHRSYIPLYTKLKLTALRFIQCGPFELLYYAYSGTQTNFKIAENSWYAFSNYVDYTLLGQNIPN